MIVAILISLVAGGFVTSLVEYKLNYNLVDKILDLFRSDKQKLQAALAKGETVVINEAGKIKKTV